MKIICACISLLNWKQWNTLNFGFLLPNVNYAWTHITVLFNHIFSHINKISLCENKHTLNQPINLHQNNKFISFNPAGLKIRKLLSHNPKIYYFKLVATTNKHDTPKKNYLSYTLYPALAPYTYEGTFSCNKRREGCLPHLKFKFISFYYFATRAWRKG